MDTIKKLENDKLAETIKEMERQRATLDLIPRYHGKDIVEHVLDEQRQQQRKRLEKAAPAPYFGRLDFKPESSETTASLYIGKAGVEGADGKDPLVIDWRAPIASLFYSFTGQSKTASYEAPEETVTGTVRLKRNIAIHEQILERIVDSYVEGDEKSGGGASDDFLLYRLEESKDHRLRDIVSTIQSEQDAIIRAEREKALVIQGVPGSGKTTVALHRLAYLLYHYQDRMKPEKMVVFAPNRMFLDYISDVLPELGVGDIQQTTFNDWALEILGTSIKLPDTAKVARDRFEQDQQSEDSSQVRYKESIDFLHQLEQTLDQYESSILPAKDLLAWEGALLSKETIRDWYDREYRHYPLLKRRERVQKRIKRWIETEHTSIRGIDPRGEWKKQANKRLQAYMKLWPKPTPLRLYRQLLRTLTNEELPRKWQPKEEDLAPLLLIQRRLTGIFPEDRFDHIVIDEAQDFSSFQTALLQKHCPLGSFTILGDLLQNIVPGRGITRWEEILDLFSEQQQGYYQLDRSYRSTMEIINFANEIIQPYRGNVKPAEPVFRSGSPVDVRSTSNKLIKHTMEALDELKSLDCRTIAVITRTENDARNLHQALLDQGKSVHLLTPGEATYQGGISIIPIYLVKGLEFDGAILTDVDQDRYPDDPFHARLLYVGCTRALHHLKLFCGGKPSPLLREARVGI
ncbi:DNA helicase-2 / ATP-dependent DNA helicase PcrA [Marininema mesophilum]|uniref:DNA helicase-2 / ATP-dependent DNA helicase PcrA n=1 Tax=Marininema mesophilum TaxID=1048340 RepID=A0A1H2Y024_9BACL|nr:UvrD-helicase domain-containing protein [Marininema mesophilum]SDW98476.1 DNA helicase-2 / ATP-dependent DNA helicase PcrA [Marininema mesophilum]